MDYLINTEALKKLKKGVDYKIEASIRTFKYIDGVAYYRAVVSIEDNNPYGFEFGYKVVTKGCVSLTEWVESNDAHNEAQSFAHSLQVQLKKKA